MNIKQFKVSTKVLLLCVIALSLGVSFVIFAATPLPANCPTPTDIYDKPRHTGTLNYAYDSDGKLTMPPIPSNPNSDLEVATEWAQNHYDKYEGLLANGASWSSAQYNSMAEVVMEYIQGQRLMENSKPGSVDYKLGQFYTENAGGIMQASEDTKNGSISGVPRTGIYFSDTYFVLPGNEDEAMSLMLPKFGSVSAVSTIETMTNADRSRALGALEIQGRTLSSAAEKATGARLEEIQAAMTLNQQQQEAFRAGGITGNQSFTNSTSYKLNLERADAIYNGGKMDGIYVPATKNVMGQAMGFSGAVTAFEERQIYSYLDDNESLSAVPEMIAGKTISVGTTQYITYDGSSWTAVNGPKAGQSVGQASQDGTVEGRQILSALLAGTSGAYVGPDGRTVITPSGTGQTDYSLRAMGNGGVYIDAQAGKTYYYAGNKTFTSNTNSNVVIFKDSSTNTYYTKDSSGNKTQYTPGQGEILTAAPAWSTGSAANGTLTFLPTDKATEYSKAILGVQSNSTKNPDYFAGLLDTVSKQAGGNEKSEGTIAGFNITTDTSKADAITIITAAYTSGRISAETFRDSIKTATGVDISGTKWQDTTTGQNLHSLEVEGLPQNTLNTQRSQQQNPSYASYNYNPSTQTIAINIPGIGGGNFKVSQGSDGKSIVVYNSSENKSYPIPYDTKDPAYIAVLNAVNPPGYTPTTTTTAASNTPPPTSAIPTGVTEQQKLAIGQALLKNNQPGIAVTWNQDGTINVSRKNDVGQNIVYYHGTIASITDSKGNITIPTIALAGSSIPLPSLPVNLNPFDPNSAWSANADNNPNNNVNWNPFDGASVWYNNPPTSPSTTQSSSTPTPSTEPAGLPVNINPLDPNSVIYNNPNNVNWNPFDGNSVWWNNSPTSSTGQDIPFGATPSLPGEVGSDTYVPTTNEYGVPGGQIGPALPPGWTESGPPVSEPPASTQNNSFDILNPSTWFDNWGQGNTDSGTIDTGSGGGTGIPMDNSGYNDSGSYTDPYSGGNSYNFNDSAGTGGGGGDGGGGGGGGDSGSQPASCPFVYSWDGEKWNFDHEGFPFAVTKAGETTSYGRLENLKSIDGKLKLKIREQLPETSWTDFLEVYSVEHPGNSIVMPDINGTPHTIQSKIIPNACIAKDGSDCLDLVKNSDEKFWTSNLNQNFQNPENYFDWINLNFEKPAEYKNVKIGLNLMKSEAITWAWQHAIDEIGKNNFSVMEKLLTNIPELNKQWQWTLTTNWRLTVEIWNGKEWINAGTVEVGREKWNESLVFADISNIKTDDLKIRLKGTTGFYEINSVFVDYSQDEPMNVNKLGILSAIKSNGVDVKDLLSSKDENYVEMTQGDEVNLEFRDISTNADWNKDYLVKIRGYYHFRDFTQNQSFFHLLGTAKDIIWPFLYKEGFEASYFMQKYVEALSAGMTK